MKLDGKTNAELQALRLQIESDPLSLNPQPNSLFRFTRKAQRKLDAIAWQITHNMSAARKAAGNPVPCDGYSGRQTNRRR